MTEEKVKVLTLYMGFPWHERPSEKDFQNYYFGSGMPLIKAVYTVREWKSNRTFTTDDDRRDLLRAIRKNEKWEEFMYHCTDNYILSGERYKRGSIAYKPFFTYWLTLDPDTIEQVCELAYEFLSKEEKND